MMGCGTGGLVTKVASVPAMRLPRNDPMAVDETRIGDGGLAHLTRLVALKVLTVIDTKISDAALDAIRRARPSVRIATEPPPKGAINPFTGKPWREGSADP
jgi:hypothetical protein